MEIFTDKTLHNLTVNIFANINLYKWISFARMQQTLTVDKKKHMQCNSTVWKKSMEVDVNRSKIFLLYFYDAYDVNLREKKFGLSAAYSCRTFVFIKFCHLLKKE